MTTNRFLRWQLALVYFGAAFNKFLDPDWQQGIFFQHWAGTRLRNPFFVPASEMLPPLVAGKVMCWVTIVVEFFAAFGLLVPRSTLAALWVHVLFQVSLVLFTGDTFGMFFFAMMAATLAFFDFIIFFLHLPL